jgi:4-aminobutyrate aminotransferase
MNGFAEAAATVLATSTYDPNIVATRYKGSRFWDIAGKEYLDFATGPGVANIGWNHPELTRALADFILKDHAGYGGNELLNPWQILLAKKIASLLPGGDYKVFFSNSGGEAVEAGTILSFLRRPERRAILSFVGDFHGRMGFSRAATTSKPEHFLRLPQAERAHYLIFPGDNPESGGFDRFRTYNYMTYVEDQIGRFIDDVSLAVFELIQGEGGINVAYLEAIRPLIAYLRTHGVLIMVDEVQTGFGRTGKFFSFEHYDIEPDIVTIAKATSGGLIPIGITAFRKELDFRKPREHSNTFGGNPQACFTALKVIEIIEREGLTARAATIGKLFHEKLMWATSFDQRYRTAMQRMMAIPGGVGLMRRMVFLKPNRQPWPEARDLVVAEALKEGLFVMAAGKATIRLMPALTVTEAELDEGVEKLMAAIIRANDELSL